MRLLPFARLLAVVSLFLGLAGCAMTPKNTAGSGTSQLIDVTITLSGAVNPNYYYFVLINRTDDFNAPGPVPVVAPPWGNGFAAPLPTAANAQGFVAAVVYNNSVGGGLSGYGVYKVPTDANNVPVALPTEIGAGLTGFVPLGQPDQYTTPQVGDRILHFRLNLSRLPNPTAKYIQINLLATNNLPAGIDPNAPKYWDALGDGTGGGAVSSLNTYLTVDATQSQQLDNSTGTEPSNDVRDHLASIVSEPSLDIADYRIQILKN